MVTTGELLDIERVTSSSERGGWKRTAVKQWRAGRLLYRTSGLGRGAKKRGQLDWITRFAPTPASAHVTQPTIS